MSVAIPPAPVPISDVTGIERHMQVFPEANEVRFDGSPNFYAATGDIHKHYYGAPTEQRPHEQKRQYPLKPIIPEPKRFRQSLLGAGRGFPFSRPTPQANLPLEYRRRGMGFGDVIRDLPDGGWELFFNITLPADHPINAGRVPDDFSRFTSLLDPRDLYEQDFEPGSSVVSSCVLGMPFRVNEADVEIHFSCRGAEGAFVALPQGSRLRKFQNIKAVRSYAARNAESWYRYINNTLGRELENGGLYLVTGYENAHSGGTASFQNAPNDFDLTLQPSRGRNGATQYRFSDGTFAQTRMFSSPVAPEFDDKPNNTVFVHGLSLSLRKAALRRRVSVEISELGDVDQPQPDKGYIPFGSKNSFFSFSSGFRSGKGVSGGGGKQASVQEVQIRDIAPTGETLNPSRLLNDLMLQKFPDAEVVITQDDVWAEALRESGGVVDPAILLERVMADFEPKEEDGMVFWERRQSLPAATGETHPPNSTAELDAGWLVSGPESDVTLDKFELPTKTIDHDPIQVAPTISRNPVFHRRTLLSSCYYDAMSPSITAAYSEMMTTSLSGRAAVQRKIESPACPSPYSDIYLAGDPFVSVALSVALSGDLDPDPCGISGRPVQVHIYSESDFDSDSDYPPALLGTKLDSEGEVGWGVPMMRRASLPRFRRMRRFGRQHPSSLADTAQPTSHPFANATSDLPICPSLLSNSWSARPILHERQRSQVRLHEQDSPNPANLTVWPSRGRQKVGWDACGQYETRSGLPVGFGRRRAVSLPSSWQSRRTERDSQGGTDWAAARARSRHPLEFDPNPSSRAIPTALDGSERRARRRATSLPPLSGRTQKTQPSLQLIGHFEQQQPQDVQRQRGRRNERDGQGTSPQQTSVVDW